MLTFTTGQARDCRGATRRDFLAAGTLALGGLALPQLLAARAAGAASGKTYVRDRAIVLLFLGGGASHIETFNPNLDAPAPYASVTGEVKTQIPGLALGGTFPQLAQHKAQGVARVQIVPPVLPAPLTPQMREKMRSNLMRRAPRQHRRALAQMQTPLR